MQDQVIGIIAQYLSVPEEDIGPNASLQSDVGLNSLDIINLIVEFEETFNIQIEEADIRGFQTVNDLVNYVASKTAGPAPANA